MIMFHGKVILSKRIKELGFDVGPSMPHRKNIGDPRWILGKDDDDDDDGDDDDDDGCQWLLYNGYIIMVINGYY